MVKSVGSCDQLDGVVETYTNASDKLATLPFHVKLETWTETGGVRVRGLKRDAHKKRRRIEMQPGEREYVVEVCAGWEVYERAVAEAQTTSWKRFCSAGWRACGTASTGSSGETGKNREDVY
ncbi:hypothetical protein EVAR_85593_1 [Eumeta japonica]|uniref:Uncharacterized protein n=1 Tax=Eumeta variegata TaxID=151549 RepID=A0A4C2ACV2_EUMVA|nr:hypothetical protein EVAR_85593_1 [Eumeta japonica]